MVSKMRPKPGHVFFPKYLDISPEESVLLLRQLELEAYAGVISALRSQGDLTKEKKGLLTEICACLGISEDRHRAEIRRAVNDEKLATIALHNSGYGSDLEWKKEGRRLVPLPRRPLEITAYMEEADRVAEIIAKENASVLPPSDVEWDDFTKRNQSSLVTPEEPAELKIRRHAVMNSSLYCANCLSKQNETTDAWTSMDDVSDGEDQDLAMCVPSASDSYVYLPSGTTVRVSTGKAEKEEQDAYSLKPNQAGNFDFGNVPEISLSGRGAKRKRKKSVGSATTSKESSVTIRQVIRPSSTSIDEYPRAGDSDVKLPDFTQKQDADIQKPNRPPVRPETKRKHTADDHPRSASGEPSSKSKRKKPVSQAVTIQHTPVPPEHLYAVGANKKSKQRKMTSTHSEDDESPLPHTRPPPEYTVVSTAQSPTKHLGLYSSRISPLSPSYYPGLGPSWSSGTIQRDTPSTSESMTTYSRGFHYSPTKPFYRPPGIGQNAYGRSSKAQPTKRHKSSPSTFSLSKKNTSGEAEHHNILHKISGKKDSSSVGIPAEEAQQHKMYSGRQGFSGNTGQYAGAMFQPAQSGTTFTVPTMSESKREQEHPSQPLPHSSSLEELASVSLMASALGAGSMVETGLAPVSAIVSRVVSPAPGQVSSAPSMKKAAQKSTVISRIQDEEGPSVQLPRVTHTFTTQVPTAFIPNRHTSTVIGVNPNAPKLKVQGSLSSISGQHPVTHQVRLAVTSTDNGTISSVPINFTSALPPPMITSPSSSQGPRVISTIAGKPHTLLKSSAGSVITVTAKPLPGVKTSVPAIVSGASIVKPQIGQKTSIIVVHKATGAKGKTVPTAFPTLGADGSKVITVSTKNLSSSELPRFTTDPAEENAPESALGSIQGLVSGLNPSGVVRKAKVIGGKPKFVTMPIHKKPVVGKVGEPGKTKIIQNVIRAPGKVLVKAPGSTLATGQLRSIPTGQVVRPITPSAVLDSSTSPDIVAAALSQSIGASVVTTSADGNPASSPNSTPTANIIKVATSTPAASTIKAFAATYQKNSSTSQLKPSFAGQSSLTTMSPSFQEKTKVFLATSPSQPKTQSMLFTPNQPQVHRSPQNIPGQKPKTSFPANAKPNVFSGSTASYLASVGNLAKANIKAVPSKTAFQPASQQSVMHVKVIGQTSSSSQPNPQPWQVGNAMNKSVGQEKGVDETTAQTKILQDIMDSSSPPPPLQAGPQPHPTTSDRATFIYQYHPTPKLVPRPDQGAGIRAPATPISTIDAGDVITLHSISSEPSLTGEKVDAPKSIPVTKPNLVKISLSTIQSSASTVESSEKQSSVATDALKKPSSETGGSKLASDKSPIYGETQGAVEWSDDPRAKRKSTEEDT